MVELSHPRSRQLYGDATQILHPVTSSYLLYFTTSTISNNTTSFALQLIYNGAH